MGLFDKLFGSAEAADDGVLDDDIASLDGKARAMIRGVVELSETTVKEIMVPRTDVTFASLESAPDELVATIAGSGHSRIPVYHDNTDNIVGMLYAKDLLLSRRGNGAAASFDLEKILRRPYLVPETKKVDELLPFFLLLCF